MSAYVLVLFLLGTQGVTHADDNTPTTPTEPVSSTGAPPHGTSTKPPTSSTPAAPKPSPGTDTLPCQSQSSSKSSSVSLPNLEEEFVVGVEATIQQWQRNYTAQVVMYHSETRNKGVVVITRDGQESTIMYNFETLQMFIINGKKCETDDIRNDRNSWFPFFNYTVSGKNGKIGNVTDVMKFGPQYTETYMNTSVVRGMPADHWIACIQWGGVTCSMEYYFTAKTYRTPVGQKPIPVRAVLKGQHTLNKDPNHTKKMENFTHNYDFMFYKPGNITDESIFQIPNGVVCQGVKPKKVQPHIPDRFSVLLEVVDRQNQFLQMAQIYYDLAANLSRFDHKPSKKDSSKMGINYGYQPLKVIHDFNTGVEYVIDKVKGNCTLQLISNKTDAIPSRTDPSHFVMQHAAEILLLTQINFTYQGKRNIRDIPVDVWAGVDSSSEENVTYEAYFLDGDWSSEVSEEADEKQILLGVWTRRAAIAGEEAHEVMYNYYNLDEDSPDVSAFDISACFDNSTQMKHMMFRVPGTYDQLVAGRHQMLQRAVRRAAAKAAGIPEMRINDIDFDQTSTAYTDVWMTILNKPYLAGSKEMDTVDLEEAYNNLKSAVDSQKLTISLGEMKSVTAKPNSLATSKEAVDPRQPVSTAGPKGHSDGSMAALGIFMMFVGVILALGVIFLLRKRVPGIPYQLQE